MKQEYHFTITRTDRICLIVFVMLLLGWELVKYLIPENKTEIIRTKPYEKTESASIEWNKNYNKEYEPAESDDNESFAELSQENEIVRAEKLTPIPIMQASVDQLRSIGFSGKVAYNISKYVAAGGVLKNEKDLMKIYGMDSIQLEKTSPFILYPVQEKDSTSYNLSTKGKSLSNYNQVIDLNQASAAELESLPGIGAVLAERIIKYRNGLGGFLQVDQIKEIYGLPPETFDKIQSSLKINTPPELIPINEIDLNSFTHPYLHKRFPRMIKAYKDQHGPFKDASDLRKVFPPDSMWCEKVLPYIKFQ